jgi:multidrug efflux pump subunit AcrA (membrane-fusion protein)
VRHRRVGLTVAVLVLAGAVALGLAPRLKRRAELSASVRAAQVAPAVAVVTPTRAPVTVDLVLPGSIQAIQEIAVYARVDGYLKARRVDLGSRVEPGQVLAEIDTPELDEQLAQARSTLSQARAVVGQARSSLGQARATLQHANATLTYNQTTLDRWRQLGARELVSKQDVDDRRVLYDGSRADVAAAEANVHSLEANVAAAEANVTANEANVARLLDLQAFHKVRAPFAGIVTARNVDNGALIGAGSSPNQTPLFRLAQIDTLRVFVSVPQTFVASIVTGLPAEILVREFPTATFRAKVVNTAGALDPAARTLLTEVHLPNPKDVLRPGMYADVKLGITRKDPPLLVPSSAVLTPAAGPRVATVAADGTLRFRAVQLGRDSGRTVEIVGGLGPEDAVVVVPRDDAREGMPVRAVPAHRAGGAS